MNQRIFGLSNQKDEMYQFLVRERLQEHQVWSSGEDCQLDSGYCKFEKLICHSSGKVK